MGRGLGDRGDGGFGTREAVGEHSPAGRHPDGYLPEERLAAEAVVALAALRVEDPELGPPARRPEPVASDVHLDPLADDVAAEADPRLAGELEMEAGRLTEGPVQAGRQARRGEEDEEGVGAPGEGGEAMEALGCARSPACASGLRRFDGRALGRAFDGQVGDEEVDRSALEEGPGHRQALVERVRGEDDEPLEPDATGDRLDGVEPAGEIEPGDDGAGRLGLRDEAEGERRLAARVIAPDRQAGPPGDASRPEDRVEGGEPGRDDPTIGGERERRR